MTGRVTETPHLLRPAASRRRPVDGGYDRPARSAARPSVAAFTVTAGQPRLRAVGHSGL